MQRVSKQLILTNLTSKKKFCKGATIEGRSCVLVAGAVGGAAATAGGRGGGTAAGGGPGGRALWPARGPPCADSAAGRRAQGRPARLPSPVAGDLILLMA